MNDRLPTQSPELSDQQLGQMLVDAYDVPPVPQSLHQRLDRIVVEHWGPPAVVVTRRHGRRRLAGSWKAWSIAASLLLAIGLVVQPWGAARVYGWQQMIEALSRRGWIEVVEQTTADAGRSRFLSLTDRVLGQRSADTAVVIDYGRAQLLRHEAAQGVVLRQPLPSAADAPSSEALVIALLCGEADSAAGDQPLPRPDRRLTDQRWQRQGDRVRLDVTFSGQDPGTDESLQVAIWLDPKTKLPLESRIVNETAQAPAMLFRYKDDADAAQWLASAIPAGLPIVDADQDDGSRARVARDAAPGTVTSLGVADPAATESLGRQPATDQDARQLEVAEALVQQPPALGGAASLPWMPLQTEPLGAGEVVSRVDALLARLWDDQGIEPAAAAGDEELLRRVYLDLAGRTPTVNEIRSYLDDSSPQRYTDLVWRLLSSRDHATHLATLWRSYLIPEGIDLSRLGGVEVFDRWLSERFLENQSYDAIARELLTAQGRLTSAGPLLFYAALKLDADQVAAKSARAFLGMRLDCAQCHDDPFEPWTQEDFWGFAAYFAQISRPRGPLEAVSTVMRVQDVDRGEVMLPESDEVVAPKLLDGSPVAEDAQTAARRQQLAAWLTSRDNPYFAKAAVNRVWALMFGRGIVDPVDGFGSQHPPLSPELLNLLAGHFVHTDFDLREIFRVVAMSRAYRLSSGAADDDGRRQSWFAQQQVKMLSAEQLYDAITVATLLDRGGAEPFTIGRFGNSRRAEFLNQFRTVGGDITEYQAGIPQALTLMNGELVASATGVAGSGLLQSLEAPFFSDDQRIEVIYLATLSRRPTASQWPLLQQYVAGRPEGTPIREPLADILWALLNSAEFVMNH